MRSDGSLKYDRRRGASCVIARRPKADLPVRQAGAAIPRKSHGGLLRSLRSLAMTAKLQRGFSLLEIMVAISILSISLLVIIDMFGGASRKSARGEDITVATMLARMKMGDVRLELEKGMTKGEFPAENKVTEGSFDEPYGDYKWVATFKKVELPVPPQMPGVPGAEAAEGTEGAENSEIMEGSSVAQDAMASAFKVVADKIGEATREIKVEITWSDLGEEQTIAVATHLVKL